MIQTIKLFELFYKAGLLEHNRKVSTQDMLDTMLVVDSLREKPQNKYMECIHTNNKGIPIAHVSAMPCYGPDIWLMQQHCSIVPGHGVKIMLDVMHAVINNESIKYVIGFYNPKNRRAAKIWELAYDIMDNIDICDISPYILNDNKLKPQDNLSPLYLRAFKTADHEIVKFLKLFARPTGQTKIKYYNAILFMVCQESKEKFKTLIK